MFRHHPDGHIKIGSFECSLSAFLLDEPAYSLPIGMIGREYAPGAYHRVFDSENQFAGQMPWPDGDAYLAKEPVYKEAQTLRETQTLRDTPLADIPPPRTISTLAFRRRFAAKELAAITLAASRALAAGDATLQVAIDDLNSASEVHLDNPEIAGGLDMLVASGLIAAERKAALLA